MMESLITQYDEQGINPVELYKRPGCRLRGFSLTHKVFGAHYLKIRELSLSVPFTLWMFMEMK